MPHGVERLASCPHAALVLMREAVADDVPHEEERHSPLVDSSEVEALVVGARAPVWVERHENRCSGMRQRQAVIGPYDDQRRQLPDVDHAYRNQVEVMSRRFARKAIHEHGDAWASEALIWVPA